MRNSVTKTEKKVANRFLIASLTDNPIYSSYINSIYKDDDSKQKNEMHFTTLYTRVQIDAVIK